MENTKGNHMETGLILQEKPMDQQKTPVVRAIAMQMPPVSRTAPLPSPQMQLSHDQGRGMTATMTGLARGGLGSKRGASYLSQHVKIRLRKLGTPKLHIYIYLMLYTSSQTPTYPYTRPGKGILEIIEIITGAQF